MNWKSFFKDSGISRDIEVIIKEECNACTHLKHKENTSHRSFQMQESEMHVENCALLYY